MDVSKIKVLYWTSSFVYLNQNDKEDIQENLAEQTANEVVISQLQDFLTSPILASQQKYVCVVERFAISLNAVPYYDSDRAESIDVYTRAGDVLTQSLVPPRSTYSLNDTIDMLNDLITGTLGGPVSVGTANFTVDAEGFVTFSFNDWATYYIVFPTYLNAILGIEPGDQSVDADEVKSQFPRFGCGDDLQRVQITSNLGVFSDNVGQSKTNILTDLNVIDDSGASSDGGFNFSQRGVLNYVPSVRRYLNFSTPAPLQTLTIRAEYVSIDGESKRILLPRGGKFSIKLGFYERL